MRSRLQDFRPVTTSAALGILFWSMQAIAGDVSVPAHRCMMRVAEDTPATENPKAVLKAGSVWGPVTQVRTSRADGRLSVCAHGDYCYATTHLAFSSPCAVSAVPMAQPATDATEWLYAVR